MKDTISLAVCNFTPVWGQPHANIEKMLSFARKAAQDGAEMILFPECALTGNDIDFESPNDLMQKNLAEEVTGESVSTLLEGLRETGIYLAFGMPERVGERVYNALVILGSEGVEAVYRKIHPFGYENRWCEGGEEPVIWESPWGRIGLGICYDIYQFPELTRYYAAKGCRLVLNATAQYESRSAAGAKEQFEQYYFATQTALVLTNEIYVAAANVTGCERFGNYGGASVILGPIAKKTQFHDPHCITYAGGESFKEEGYTIGTIDLTLAVRDFDKGGPNGCHRPLRPEYYRNWYSEL